MSTATSTITAKWQITIPEEVRKELPFKIGQRIVWEVEGDKLVGRRLRSIKELAGSLSATHHPASKSAGPDSFERGAIARHDRISRQKS